MKRKLTFAMLSLACAVFSLDAAPRSAKEALKVAKTFYEGKSLLRSTTDADFKLVYTGEENTLRSSSGTPYYYIYNVGENGGFVMVSGDDCVTPVIGYALSGSFTSNNMPANMKGWFKEYERQIDYMKMFPDYSYTEELVSLRADDNLPKSVAPLIKTKWDQMYPYNQVCPTSNGQEVLTGCAATAMAQIMNFHQWPKEAVGEGSFTLPEEGPEKYIVELDGIAFDWENMENIYDESSTEEQNEAVATLMYAAGAAADMQYGSEESGTINEAVIEGFLKNFNYDKNISFHHRQFYTKQQWYTLLKKELAANRPILYGAQNIEGGHDFICDGYDENNFFHINWGWSGTLNNFFKLDLLWENDPTSNISGYNIDQDVIIGIQKPTTTSSPARTAKLMCLEATDDTINYGDPIDFEYVIQYIGSLTNANIELSFDLYQDNKIVDNITESTWMLSEEKYDKETDTISLTDYDFEPGTYEIAIRYRFTDEENWRELERALGTRNNKLTFTVTEQEIIFEETEGLLKGQPLVIEKSTNDNFNYIAKTTIINESDLDVAIPLLINISSQELEMDTTFFVAGVYMSPKEEQNLEIPLIIDLQTGEYSCQLMEAPFLLNLDGDDDDDEEEDDDDEATVIKYTTTTFVVKSHTTLAEKPEMESLSIHTSGDNLFIDSNLQIGKVYIYDNSGRLIGCGQGSEITIPGLSAGIYHIQIETDKKTITRSLFIR